MKEQVEKLDKAVKALVRLDDVVDKSELNGYIEDALTKTNDGTLYRQQLEQFPGSKSNLLRKYPLMSMQQKQK